jgi:hypothetical protein
MSNHMDVSTIQYYSPAKAILSVDVNLEEPISSGYPAQPGLIGESVGYGCVHVALIL